jgi:hypothetical protein
MRTFRVLAVFFVLGAGVSLPGRLPAGAQTPPKEAAEDRPLPLVRMDLLDRGPAQATPSGRNIFSPQPAQPGRSMAGGPGDPVPAGLPAGQLGGAAAAGDAPSGVQPAAAPAFSIDIRFIGYVDSLKTRKIIGLVIFQGQARAVVEGEVISEGVRIGKIGREEIEVVLPDASTRTFSLEGEE